MTTVLSHLTKMRGLQVLVPYWLLGLVIVVWQFTPWMILAFVWGLVLQFLFEYVLHRFAYHGEPPTDQSAFSKLYRTHLAHHEFPSDPRFFTGDAPWWGFRVAAFFAFVHFVVLWPFFGWAMAASLATTAIFVGGISAFFFYEYCHTIAHLNVPKGPFGKWVTKTHLAHHFEDHHATFHVSAGMGWIDRLFGTGLDKEKARERFDRSTILTLGLDKNDPRLVQARSDHCVTK